jgi:predicted acyltransferase
MPSWGLLVIRSEILPNLCWSSLFPERRLLVTGSFVLSRVVSSGLNMAANVKVIDRLVSSQWTSLACDVA